MASSGARFVLIIASGEDSPSASAIAERTGMSPRAVKDHLRELQRDGLLANDAINGQRPRWRPTGAGSALVEYLGVKSVPADTAAPSAAEYPKESSCLRDKMTASTAESVSRDCAETIRLLREENGALRSSDRRQRGELRRLRPVAAAVKPLKAELARLRRDQVTRMLSSEFPLIPLAAPVYRMPAARRVLEDQIIALDVENKELRAEVRAAGAREKALLRTALVHDGGGLARSPMHAVLGRVSMMQGTADGKEAGHGSGAARPAAARRGGDLAVRRDW